MRDEFKIPAAKGQGDRNVAVDRNSAVPNSEKVLNFQLATGVAFAVLWAVFWIYTFLTREHLSQSRWMMLKVFTIVCASLFGILVAGEGFFRWRASGPTFELLIYGTAGFAMMLILNYIFPKFIQPTEKPEEKQTTSTEQGDSPSYSNGTLPANSNSDKKVEQPAANPIEGKRPMKQVSKRVAKQRSRAMFERIVEELADKHLNEYVAVGPDGLVAHAKTEEQLRGKIAGREDFETLAVEHVHFEEFKNFHFGGPSIIRFAPTGNSRGR